MADRQQEKFMTRVAAFVVDRRGFFFLLFIALGIFSAFSRNWVNVDEKITNFLAPDTETRQGIDLMEREFVTYATADVMVENVTLPQAENILAELESVPGVKSVAFDGSDAHYKNTAALFSVTFEGDNNAEASLQAVAGVRELLSGYDLYMYTEVGDPLKTIINREMLIVDAIAVIIVISVLLLTSKTYGEIPVLLMTFGAAALLNMGTNFLMGTISYVTDSIAIVLQLALAVDYAIILFHRYLEEHEKLPPREAAIAALSKAIPEICGSSLTTVGGLMALCFMKFRLGYDIGTVLIKAILLSLFSVFFLMPGLLVLFSGIIDRTHHRSVIPPISFLGRAAYKTRYVVPPLFAVVIVLALIFSGRSHYVYNQYSVDSIRHNEEQLAERHIREIFGKNNTMALVVPAGDYESERKLVADIEALPRTVKVTALANVEAVDGYCLADEVTPRQFSEIAGVDVEAAQVLFSGYAVERDELGQIVTNLDNYGVPLISVFDYLNEKLDSMELDLPQDIRDRLDELKEELDDGKKQLQSESYSRMVVELDLPVEEKESFDYLNILHGCAAKYYNEYYVVGDTTSCSDLAASFVSDNRLISVLSIFFVLLVLFFTFKSAGLPVLLIAIIQGSIWCNFSVPYLFGKDLFFLTYLIISSIQMGANIDYAIVISSRYLELKERMPLKEAMIETLNLAFPTIITSGTMMASAGIVIGFIASNETISAIGVYLGIGTCISIFLVMCVLPQILLLGDTILKKTSVRFKGLPTVSRTGMVRLDGRVVGKIDGVIEAEVHGYIRGSFSGVVTHGTATETEEDGQEGAGE